MLLSSDKRWRTTIVPVFTFILAGQVHADSKTCQIVSTNTTCELVCEAASASQVCDGAMNRCRSTCGLYGGNDAGAEILQGLIDAAPPEAQERREIITRAYFNVIASLREMASDLAPRTYAVIFGELDWREPNEAPRIRPVAGEPVPVEKGQSAILFTLQPETISALKSDVSPAAMLDAAASYFSKAHAEK
jgi:hypothetical protein